MNKEQEITFRTREDIISDIRDLISKPGYIYSLCLILFEDFHMPLEKLGTINYRERLSVKEAAFILGYLIQNKIDCTYPESVESLIQNKELTYISMYWKLTGMETGSKVWSEKREKLSLS